MRNALKKTIVTSILAVSVAGAPTLFAATAQNNTEAAHPAHKSTTMQGKNSHGNAMGMMNNGDKMPMMKMMAQMNRMMRNCNQMMEQKMNKSANPTSSADKG